MSGHDEGTPPGGGDAGQSWTPPGTYPPHGSSSGAGPAYPPGAGQQGQPGQQGQQGQQGQGPAPGPWGPQGPVHGAAHKPGAVPLRPLHLGDLYDAAFKIIRHNPKATVGSAALVAAAAMSVPVLIALVATAFVDVDAGVMGALSDPTEPAPDPTTGDGPGAGFVAGFGALMIGSVLQWAGLVLVTGMIAHVTMAAALGRTMGLGEAWTATKGRRARLIGLMVVLALVPLVALGVYALLWLAVLALGVTALSVVFGLVTVPAVLVLLVIYFVRVQYLAVPPMMLEGTGIRGSLERAFRLSRDEGWRLLGIAVLTGLITGAAGFVLGLPVTVVQQVLFATVESGQALLLVYVVGQALATVLSSAFVTPFSAGVASLLYLDMRIRKEGFDVELLAAAGLPTGGASGGGGAGPPGGPQAGWPGPA